MPNTFHPIELIQRKRDGRELSPDEVRALVEAVVHLGDGNRAPSGPRITEAQIAAMLMAIFLRGLTAEELSALTDAMRRSGDTLHLDALNAFTVDKHSTGGVGDKTSLLIAPILAAAGQAAAGLTLPNIVVPMISGRSLGHTGGTLDKLETIPGFRTDLPLPALMSTLQQHHAALVGQSPTLVPADRILYALRDHTGTVESPALITASIMSKKLAEDLRGLVLDVKVGSGAFMPTPEASRHLAELLVTTGNRAGTRTVALLTSMDQPLGRFAGNWLEVRECVDILQGQRHPLSADLVELSLTLAGWMLHLAGHAATPGDGARLADGYLASGAAYAAWLGLVAAQGGDTGVFADMTTPHAGMPSTIVTARTAGYLAAMDCKEVGWAVQRLGAGRTRPGDAVSAHAGLEMHAKLGDRVYAGQPLCTLYAGEAQRLTEPAAMLNGTFLIRPDPLPPVPLVHGVVQ